MRIRHVNHKGKKGFFVECRESEKQNLLNRLELTGGLQEDKNGLAIAYFNAWSKVDIEQEFEEYVATNYDGNDFTPLLPKEVDTILRALSEMPIGSNEMDFIQDEIEKVLEARKS